MENLTLSWDKLLTLLSVNDTAFVPISMFQISEPRPTFVYTLYFEKNYAV